MAERSEYIEQIHEITRGWSDEALYALARDLKRRDPVPGPVEPTDS